MRILAIDTSGPAASAAVYENRLLAQAYVENSGRPVHNCMNTLPAFASRATGYTGRNGTYVNSAVRIFRRKVGNKRSGCRF